MITNSEKIIMDSDKEPFTDYKALFEKLKSFCKDKQIIFITPKAPDPIKYDWDKLKDDVSIDGIRHKTITVTLPGRDDTVLRPLSNVTDGIYPVRTASDEYLATKQYYLQVLKSRNNNDHSADQHRYSYDPTCRLRDVD